MDTALRNLRWADALVDGLAHCGVRHAVVSPGSRSTPLTLAVGQHPGIRTWVLPDERSAAFFALGLGRGSGGPACVIATSGSAPANWFPAVVEAAADRRPLILLSADRPEELHACGANQTIDQIRLFGQHVRWFVNLPVPDAGVPDLRHAGVRAVQAVDRSRWPVPGPVHVNVPFREPLVPAHPPQPGQPPSQPLPLARHPRLAPAPGDTAELAAWVAGRRGLIVCGPGGQAPDFPEAVASLARRLGCPILADPLSGLRFGPHDRSRVLASYDAWLRRRAFTGTVRPDWVLRFGTVPVSKPLQQYLGGLAPGSAVLVVPYTTWPDPGERSTRVLHVDPELLCRALAEAVPASADATWWGRWQDEERRAARLLQVQQRVPLEASVLGVLAHLLPGGARIFCGNSLVIRDVDSFMLGGAQALTLVGNRGASGIDGNVSSVLGLAAGGGGPVVGLLGDLALYHDMNGLLAARGLTATLLVFNNDGGAIFGYMPQSELAEFERYWLTPTGLDIGRIAALYGLTHHRVRDADQLEAAVSASLDAPGVDLIELMVDRQDSLARHRAYWSAVADARD
jgi:2-succinyl-5-enolpyruvyl-6-hydroxy-3-cyclohexene-1-carboxylate synthase